MRTHQRPILKPSDAVEYRIENSKHDIEVTLPRLLILLTKLFTGGLFKIVQKDLIPEEKVLYLLKVDVTKFDNGFKKHCVTDIINFILLGS